MAPDAAAFAQIEEADQAGGPGSKIGESVHKLPDGTKVTIGRADCARVGEALFDPAALASAGCAGASELRLQCGLPTATMRAVP